MFGTLSVAPVTVLFEIVHCPLVAPESAPAKMLTSLAETVLPVRPMAPTAPYAT